MSKPEKVTGSEMVATKELRARGWTPILIKRFVAIPDAIRQNPHYRKAAPMKLYVLARIEAVEATEEFKAAVAEASRRQQAALRAVAKKKESTRQWALSLPAPELPAAPRDELARLAVDRYNDYWPWRTEKAGKWASIVDPEEILAHIQVNYILLKLSDYEKRVRQAFGHVGADEAAGVIKNRILEAIAVKYPWLAAACTQQKGA